MKFNKKLVSIILFNIAETCVIYLVGRLLNLPTNFILIVMLTFLISRGFFGNALHFKTWYRCIIWSCLILLSLFLILKVDLVISILFTEFAQKMIQEVESPEAKQVIKKHLRKISQMSGM